MVKLATLRSSGTAYTVVDLPAEIGAELIRLPWVLRILLENVLRTAPADEAIAARAGFFGWLASGTSTVEIPFSPVRILMHDTTCLPALADIAAMREALAKVGGDPSRLVPKLPVDVSVDHSVAVDHFGTRDAFAKNMARELEHNGERYRFMKWAGNVMPGLRIHPPGTGIMHTLNLEQLATVVATGDRSGASGASGWPAGDAQAKWAFPDTLIGTDSHTPMINGIGVLGWGVGGLEAEGAMFGLPVMLRIPDVIGVRLTGALAAGSCATDLALTVTQKLRTRGLDSAFVEFFGPGVSTLTAGERAVVANMAPEYGASSGFFPVDDQTCRYLAMTGRTQEQVSLIEDYARRVGLWFDPDAAPRYTDVLEFDLASIDTSVAGPHRPQDRLSPSRIPEVLAPVLSQRQSGAASSSAPPNGAIALAAITSCTNTSDPGLLVAAGLLARKARALGLKPQGWVKTSLAPGSPAARALLERAGLLDDLAALGFDIVGYGCTTCIGNSGPLAPQMAAAIERGGVTPVAVLSGNRNFPGRIHPDIDHAFLTSPALVVAFALAGDANLDVLNDFIGTSVEGVPVRLADLWPGSLEIEQALAHGCRPEDYPLAFAQASRNPAWTALDAPSTQLFPWNPASTYLRPPPFATLAARTPHEILSAQPLLVLGDDVTTDHISPAGQIPADSEAGAHLLERQELRQDLNVYAARRGNWEVMLRGLFANRSVVNHLAPGIAGGQTFFASRSGLGPDADFAPTGAMMPVWRAAERYREEGTPVVLVAGERYGTGSSRDWAAKGLALLGVRVVLAVSFERIHRTNLIGMGILPLQLAARDHPRELALVPGDRIELDVVWAALTPRMNMTADIRRLSGSTQCIDATLAVETSLEADILRAGGMLPMILDRAAAQR